MGREGYLGELELGLRKVPTSPSFQSDSLSTKCLLCAAAPGRQDLRQESRPQGLLTLAFCSSGPSFFFLVVEPDPHLNKHLVAVSAWPARSPSLA